MVKQLTHETINRERFPGVEIIATEDSRKAHIEIKMDGISAKDINVRPMEDTLLVLKSDGSEFKRFLLPESVDPFTVEAVMKDGVLIVDAPLTCEHRD